MAAAGLGEDLLVANEVVDARRLSALAALDARVTVAVDSDATVDAAAQAGPRVRGRRERRLAALRLRARRRGPAGRRGPPPRSRGAGRHGLRGPRRGVARPGGAGPPDRGVHGGAGPGPRRRRRGAHLGRGNRHLRHQRARHRDPGRLLRADGPGVRRAGSAVSTGALRARHGHLDEPGRRVHGRRLRAEGPGDGSRQPGDRRRDGVVLLGRARDVLVRPGPTARLPAVGGRVAVWPAHIDPTVAYHDRMHVVDGERVVEVWPVDLRGW